MEGIVAQAMLGIVTGILTTALLWLLKAAWDAKLHPLLQKARYDGIIVAGKWRGTGDGDDGSRTEVTLYLNQNAHAISGTFAVDHDSPRKKYTIHHSASGFVREGLMILTFSPVDRRITSYSMAMLKITGAGSALSGQLVFRAVDSESVVAEQVELVRDESNEAK